MKSGGAVNVINTEAWKCNFGDKGDVQICQDICPDQHFYSRYYKLYNLFCMNMPHSEFKF